jgi:hypothetical protein
MKPVLNLARQLDIASNPDPRAIFEAGSGGFQIWCLPTDHPKGWNGISMNSGAFSKPCEYVGSAHWKWDEEKIVALEIETSAYSLADQKPDEYSQRTNHSPHNNQRTIFNRDADIQWLKEKITWLFAEAGVPLLPFAYEQAPLSQLGPYILAHYLSNTDDYVVIVSPELDPREFCKPGYEVVHTLEIWRAGDFPADVILRPDRDMLETVIEPDLSPLLDPFKTITNPHQDGWLEADFEDRISGILE